MTLEDLDLDGTSREDLPALLGKLVELEARVRLRLAEPEVRGRAEDRGLDVDAAAKRLGMSPAWVYRNADKLPFARRVGRRLVFSSAGVDAYLARRR